MIKIISYEPVSDKKSLVGYFSILIPEWNLTISRCCEFKKNEQMWVNVPSFAVEKENGSVAFMPFLTFLPDIQKKFLDSVHQALKEFKNQKNYNNPSEVE